MYVEQDGEYGMDENETELVLIIFPKQSVRLCQREL
jgi:hypothetical protein